MKDRGGLEAEEEADIEDMNTSTLVISESAISINGEDSRDSCNQLSIDTGETDQDLVQTAAIAKPSIRIAKGLTKDNNENHAPMGMGGILAATLQAGTKRKQCNGGPIVSPLFSSGGLVSPPQQGPVVKKQRHLDAENDQEIVSLEKEVRALQWLARRKEKEWDQVISLLKQKEEKLVKAQRTRVLSQAEAEHFLSKHKPAQVPLSPKQPLSSPATVVLPGCATVAPVIVPQQQVLILPSSVSMTSPLTTVNTSSARLIQPKPLAVKPVTTAPSVTNLTTRTVASSAGVTLRSKSPGVAHRHNNGSEQIPEQNNASTSLTAERPAKILQKTVSGGILSTTKEEVKKITPDCQGCSKKKSEFVCAGCSNRWYCSRECQVKRTSDPSVVVKINLFQVEDWDEHADECSG